MLTPPRSTAPRCSAAPERMLPVCPGWMPTPVACLLNRPLTTLILPRRSLSGWRLRPSSIPSPEPFAHQCSGLIPQPMNSAANRFGHGAGTPPAIGALPLEAAGEGRAGVDGMAAEVEGSPLPDRAVALEGQADRVEPLVAPGARPVGPVDLQRLAEGPFGLGLVLGQVGDVGR